MASKRELEIRLKLKNEFPHFAYKCLKIRTKEAKFVPFALNKAQLYLHDLLEKQKKKREK